MIPRSAATTLRRLARGFPVLVVTGPRQSGKTTLVRDTFPRKPFVSLEDPDERAFAARDPRGFLARFPRGATIDEAQHGAALLSYLQTRVDRERRMGGWVLTGSQQFGLVSTMTQSLAGRAGLLQLLPFSYAELAAAGVSAGSLDRLLYAGLYPALYDRKIKVADWFAGYLMTYLERDVRQLSHVQDLNLFQRFVRMCAARTAQLLNLASLAADCGVSQNTARAWLSILEASYVAFLLPPHFRNFGKRLVKTPKLYFYDTGLAAALLGLQGPEHMAIHPSRPALFETLVVNEFLKARWNAGLASNLSFWRDNTGTEVDLVLDQGARLAPIEIKSGQTVSGDFFAGLRRWLKYAGEGSAAPALVYGGEESYLREGIEVRSWRRCLEPAGRRRI